jgi:hypothetical protein
VEAEERVLVPCGVLGGATFVRSPGLEEVLSKVEGGPLIYTTEMTTRR